MGKTRALQLGWHKKACQIVLFWLALFLTGLAFADGIEHDTVIDPNVPVKAVIGDLHFRECSISAQQRDRKVQCAWYEVAENPQAREGKRIKLFVVRIPAKRHLKHIQDPVLFISGGPGQAASETYLFADQMWPSLAKNRDFYLIDQRGTGFSNPQHCDEVAGLQEDSFAEYDSAAMRELASQCLAQMGGDLRFYTTDATVKDFESVRAGLGIERWNLLGVSYGTRVATHYMRVAPAGIRSVVLDSVVPPGKVLGLEIASRSQDILDLLYRRCEEDLKCSEAMPALRSDVEALLATLENAPLLTRVENFSTGEVEEVAFSRNHVVTLIRMFLYNPQTLSLLPPMLHEAAVNRNYSPVVRAARQVSKSLASSTSLGLSNSVICTEEYPYFDRLSAQQESANRNAYLGMTLIQRMEEMCSLWPKGEIIAQMREPLTSDIPALLLSGEYDPITPPAYAEELLADLGSATHLVLPGQGHFVSATGCAPELVAKFVDAASSEELNSRCLERLSPAPLFINFNGAAP